MYALKIILCPFVKGQARSADFFRTYAGWNSYSTITDSISELEDFLPGGFGTLAKGLGWFTLRCGQHNRHTVVTTFPNLGK